MLSVLHLLERQRNLGRGTQCTLTLLEYIYVYYKNLPLKSTGNCGGVDVIILDSLINQVFLFCSKYWETNYFYGCLI